MTVNLILSQCLHKLLIGLWVWNWKIVLDLFKGLNNLIFTQMTFYETRFKSIHLFFGLFSSWWIHYSIVSNFTSCECIINFKQKVKFSLNKTKMRKDNFDFEHLRPFTVLNKMKFTVLQESLYMTPLINNTISQLR